MAWNCVFLHIVLALISIVGIVAEKHSQVESILYGNDVLANVYNILSKDQGNNILFSPVSIHALLSMAAQGAGGKTRADLIQVLAVPNLQVAADGYQDVMQGLNSAQNITLHIANKIYLMQDYPLNPDFNAVVSQKFLSEVESVDFSQAKQAADTINQWVEKKTNNKIKDLITPESINEDTSLILVNALYFKGRWREKFDTEQTRKEKFYNSDQNTVEVEMMHTTKYFLYKEDSNLQAKLLEMPYTNPDFNMLIILPNYANGIADLEKKIAEWDITKITEGMYKHEVNVSLPKFKIETTMDLKDTLSALGLREIFSTTANFSGMLSIDEPLAVSEIIQKASVEVNEEGAEAAAATGMVITGDSLEFPETPKEFVANHPFIVVLRAKHACDTVVLFQGRISKF